MKSKGGVSKTVSVIYQGVTNKLENKSGSSVCRRNRGRRKFRSVCLSHSADSVLSGAKRTVFENKKFLKGWTTATCCSNSKAAVFLDFVCFTSFAPQRKWTGLLLKEH